MSAFGQLLLALGRFLSAYVGSGYKALGIKQMPTFPASEDVCAPEVRNAKSSEIDFGQWVIAKFVFKERINYYLAQITGMFEGEFEFEFYRELYQSLRVFQKIQPREIHPEDIIVELLEKERIDIMCGSKVKIMGENLSYKCV